MYSKSMGGRPVREVVTIVKAIPAGAALHSKDCQILSLLAGVRFQPVRKAGAVANSIKRTLEEFGVAR